MEPREEWRIWGVLIGAAAALGGFFLALHKRHVDIIRADKALEDRVTALETWRVEHDEWARSREKELTDDIVELNRLAAVMGSQVVALEASTSQLVAAMVTTNKELNRVCGRLDAVLNRKRQ